MGALALAGCGFPDVNYDGPPEGGGSSGRSDAQDDQPVVSDVRAAGDRTAALDTSVPDARPIDAGGVDSTTTPEAATPDAQDEDASVVDAGVMDAPADVSCDCAADAMLYKPNVSCAGLLGLLCGQTEGFSGSPPCGTVGDYVQCGTGIVCVVTSSMRVQQCK
jgi:hypothetical protein